MRYIFLSVIISIIAGWISYPGNSVADAADIGRAPVSACDAGQPIPLTLAAVKEEPAAPPGKSATTGVPVGNDAKGTIVYKTFSVPLKYAWLAKGPYTAEPGKVVRRLFLSSKDIGQALQACKTISCADGQVTEGMTVDFDVGPRLNYWISVNGQKVQWSGAARPEAFTARVNEPGHLAGSLAIDDVAMGGPKIDADFNVTLLREFPRER